MTTPQPGNDVTIALQRMKSGDQAAADEVFQIVYEDLRRFARGLFFPGEANTLQPTALVNDAYLRLVRQVDATWESRRHFFDVAAMAMRQLLTDHARKRKAAKRGGDRGRLAFEDVASQLFQPANNESQVDLEALDEAMAELEQLDDRQSQIVRLRFFAGLGVEEVAKLLEVSERTVHRDWQMARAWLHRRLQANPSDC